MNDDSYQIVPDIRREFVVGKQTLTAEECAQYRIGRDAVLGVVQERTGLRIAVVEGGAEHAKQIQAELQPDQWAVHTWKGKQ